MLAAYSLNPNYKLEWLKDSATIKAKESMLALLLSMKFDRGVEETLLKEFEMYAKAMKQMNSKVEDVHV